MLPASHRLRESDSFRHVIRFGVKAGRSTLVIHMTATNRAKSRAGFVVSKAVGNAVIRNRVKRRLRHLMAAKFGPTVGDTDLVVDVVVRANPAAAGPEAPIVADFDSAWATCQKRVAA